MSSTTPWWWYTCRNCGNQMTPGIVHRCATTIPVKAKTAEERTAAALERIATALEWLNS